MKMTENSALSEAPWIEDEENLIIDAQFLIQDILNDRKMTRADLARLTGLSRARISQILGSNSNMTLRLLARILHVLGHKTTLPRYNREPEEMHGLLQIGNYWIQENDAVAPEIKSADSRIMQNLNKIYRDRSHFANDNVTIFDNERRKKAFC